MLPRMRDSLQVLLALYRTRPAVERRLSVLEKLPLLASLFEKMFLLRKPHFLLFFAIFLEETEETSLFLGNKRHPRHSKHSLG